MSTIARRRLVLLGVLGLLAMAISAARSAAGRGDDPAAKSPQAGRHVPRPRVALQVGHWQDDRVPAELRRVGVAAGGAAVDGAIEWQVSYLIARETQRLLQVRGIAAELVPTTVPQRYSAAAFVSIHADANDDPRVTGFKSAPSQRDRSARSDALNQSVARRYAQRTGLPWNTAITEDMTGYYAFDGRRFRHAIDPATPAVIIETGFLTSPQDRRVIVGSPAQAGRGIADGISEFLARG